MQSTGPGDDDWELEAVCSVETLALKYNSDAVKTYSLLDKILAKYNIVLDDTMSPYKRPNRKVGVALTFHIDDAHDINMVEGAGFLIYYGNIHMRDLGWKKVRGSTPQAYIMPDDVATQRSHAGSTTSYAELDSLEQRVLAMYPPDRNYLVWKYVKTNSDGSTQLTNLLPPTTVSRFVAIDAKRQKLAAPVHRIHIVDVDDDDGTHDLGQPVTVEAAGPGSPNTSAVDGVSALAPAKNTSETLSAVVDSHLLIETSKNLCFDVQAAPDNGTAGSPEATDVATISPNTPPKETSSNLFDKPQHKSINNDEAGTQLFGDATGGQSDVDSE